MANNNNNNKYTNMEMHTCYNNSTGKNYVFAVIGPVYLTKISQETSRNGVSYVRASIPVDGQAERINAMLGTQYNAGDTAWISASIFFGKNGAPGRAGYLMNQLQQRGNPKSIRALVTGQMTANDWTDNNGNRHVDAQIVVSGLHMMDTARNGNDGQSGYQQNGGQQAQQNGSPAAQYFRGQGNGNGGYQQNGYQNNGGQQRGYQQNGQQAPQSGYQQNGYQNNGGQQRGYQQNSQQGQQNGYQPQQNSGYRNNGGQQTPQGGYQQNSGYQNNGGQQNGYQPQQGGFQNGGQQAQQPQQAPQYTPANNGFGNATGFSTLESDDGDLPF